MTETDPIALSALQHWVYCPRQCGLINRGRLTAAGRKRLRRVAKVCESMGQRVQKSVFECTVDEMQLEQLERTLLAEIDETQNNLRFYRITEPVEVRVKEHACFRSLDFEGPLLA